MPATLRKMSLLPSNASGLPVRSLFSESVPCASSVEHKAKFMYFPLCHNNAAAWVYSKHIVRQYMKSFKINILKSKTQDNRQNVNRKADMHVRYISHAQ